MITAISPAMYAAKGVSFTEIQKSQIQQNKSETVKNNPSFGLGDNSYSGNLKIIGAIMTILALFAGVGYYAYESLFVAPTVD